MKHPQKVLETPLKLRDKQALWKLFVQLLTRGIHREASAPKNTSLICKFKYLAKSIFRPEFGVWTLLTINRTECGQIFKAGSKRFTTRVSSLKVS